MKIEKLNIADTDLLDKNIRVEKVMSQKQNQQQSVGGVWMVVEVVLHVPVVL